MTEVPRRRAPETTLLIGVLKHFAPACSGYNVSYGAVRTRVVLNRNKFRLL
jgi:hypothetical protein